MVVGLAYHNTVAMALSYKMANLAISDKEIALAFRDFWQRELTDKIIYDEDGVPQIEATDVEWGKDDPDRLLRAGARLAQKYNRFYVPKMNPIAVEKEYRVSVAGLPDITGRLDAEESGNKVYDHKFKKNAMHDADLTRDMQSMTYALLRGTPLYMEFHQALEGRAWDNFPKDAGLIPAKITRTASDVEWFKQALHEYWHQIEAEVFPPNPTSYLCSFDYCPYYINCKLEDN
jgi:hypothetical protein